MLPVHLYICTHRSNQFMHLSASLLPSSGVTETTNHANYPQRLCIPVNIKDITPSIKYITSKHHKTRPQLIKLNLY